MILISGCLAGIDCRYDGGNENNPRLLESLKGSPFLPLCPEQLGGLPTPRPKAEIMGGDGHDVLAKRARVLDEQGRDVTSPFIKGAMETLKLVKLLGIKKAYLKGKSPSCGFGGIMRGSNLVKGDGVCAALLSQNRLNITCI